MYRLDNDDTKNCRNLLRLHYLDIFYKIIFSFIASKREANNPTFLKLLCTEMSKFGIFEKVHEQLNVLSQSMESMLETVAQSVEDEVGIDFMRKVIPLLVASSHFGITELRLLKLIQRIGIESASLTLFLFLNGLEVFLQPLDENYGVVQLKTGIFQVSTVPVVKYRPHKLFFS